MEWIYDVNARNNLFVQGLRDSVREADPYYISARGDVENYIVENVERADIWTSYYAGRCGGDMINEQVAYTKLGLMVLSACYTGGAMGGSLEVFFSRFTMRSALANGGGINLVDVWLRRTEASQGMGEAIKKGRQKAEVEKGTGVDFDRSKLSRSQQKAIESAGNIINDHLKNSDLSAALSDLQGNPIAKPNGGYWNHAQEVKDAYIGLTRTEKTLAGSLQNPNLAPDVRTFIQGKYNSISNYISIIEEMFAPYGGIK